MAPPYLGPDELARLFNAEEFEPLARERMISDAAARFLAGGAGSETGLRANRTAFDGWVFRPRVLVDVSDIDLSTTVLGERVEVPLLFAPSALHRISHPDGELATGRAARSAGTIMILSTSSSIPLEEVATTGAPRWFQLYWLTDREITRDLIQRAQAAGYTALCLTVDAPVFGWREAEMALGDWDLGLVEQANLPVPLPPGVRTENRLTWRSLDWIRSVSTLPIVLKGIMTPEDAIIAADEGMRAVIVSNHGGRQLDHAMPSIVALPEIADAVGDRLELLLDSGVRRGTDVLKALALGARAALIGRPVQWGLAAGGQPGLERLVEVISGELRTAMALTGVTTTAAISRAIIARRQE